MASDLPSSRPTCLPISKSRLLPNSTMGTFMVEIPLILLIILT